MVMNTPNLLTILRIIAIPIFVLFFYLPLSWNHLASAFIFAVAALTDWLDGYIARTFHQTSALGEFLDPVADKLVVAVALVLLVGEKSLPYLAIPAAVIVGREIVISALREWMAEIGKRASVAVSFVGKVKTFLQMVAIFLLLLYTPHGQVILVILGYIFLYLAAILTLWSMAMYIKTAWPDLTLKPK
jgi:CDP-diacylglycerol--glycerol-3-phosphate 3-phosphatidyltransferase